MYALSASFRSKIDPPEHANYRAIAEPFFNRAKLPEVIAQMEALVRSLLSSALQRESIEIVREFAIPLQSRALALLLNMPDSEAEIWIGWGMHVFREGNGKSKGAALEKYMNSLFDRGERRAERQFFQPIDPGHVPRTPAHPRGNARLRKHHVRRWTRHGHQLHLRCHRPPFGQPGRTSNISAKIRSGS